MSDKAPRKDDPPADAAPPSEADLQRKFFERGLRHTLWVATFFARSLSLQELANQLTTLLVNEKDRQNFKGEA